MEYQQIAPLVARIKQNIQKVIIGKEKEIELVLSAIICGGHVLLEDVPGTGKTTLAKALAKSMNGGFARVQFTPDLLPADVTGTRVFRQQTGDFVFMRGPVFTNILLADEINRATPRTQSAPAFSSSSRFSSPLPPKSWPMTGRSRYCASIYSMASKDHSLASPTI